MDREKAELYMQIYQYAAEDFTSIPDQINHDNLWLQHAVSVENRLVELGVQLNVHTHALTPHTHLLPPAVIDHQHIVTGGGSYPGGTALPSADMVIGSTQPVNIVDPVQSMPAYNASDLLWTFELPPSPIINTTGAVSNLALNFISYSGVLIGELLNVKKRRALTIPVLTVPTITPIAKSLITAGI
jgi:hypothetical protein